MLAADAAELVQREGRGEVWVLHNASGLSAQLRLLVSPRNAPPLCLTREPEQSVSATLQRLAGKAKLPEGARVALCLGGEGGGGGEELAAARVPAKRSRPKKGAQTPAEAAEAARAAAEARAEAEAGVEAGAELSNEQAFVDGNVLVLGDEVLRIMRQVPVRRGGGRGKRRVRRL